jgi:hypothetical protein
MNAIDASAHREELVLKNQLLLLSPVPYPVHHILLTIHSDLKLAGCMGGGLAINGDALSILPSILLHYGLHVQYTFGNAVLNVLYAPN